MSILIHACCADCLLKLLEALNKEQGKFKQKIAVLFYNPNIYPREEYQARLKAVKKIALEKKLELIVPNYKPQKYFVSVGGISEKLHEDKNKKIRCPKCWNLRLNFAFETAKTRNFETVTSTLLSSSYQDQKEIKKIALSLAQKYQVRFHEVKEINHCLKTSGFYKQNYCGCLFSLIEKSIEKYAIKESKNTNPKYSKNCG